MSRIIIHSIFTRAGASNAVRFSKMHNETLTFAGKKHHISENDVFSFYVLHIYSFCANIIA